MLLRFPDDPYVGETYGSYTWDGVKWACTRSVPISTNFPPRPLINENYGPWHWDGQKWVCGNIVPPPPPLLPTIRYWAYRQASGVNNASWNNVPIGSASPTRVVIVAFSSWNFCNSSSTPTSVTIGGIPAQQAYWGLLSGGAAGIYYANVPNGDTATIAMSFNGSSWPSVFVYTADGLTSTVPVDIQGVIGAGGVTLTGAAGGVAMAQAFSLGTDTSFASWTGLVSDDLVTYTLTSNSYVNGVLVSQTRTVQALGEVASTPLVPSNSFFVNAARRVNGAMTLCALAFR